MAAKQVSDALVEGTFREAVARMPASPTADWGQARRYNVEHGGRWLIPIHYADTALGPSHGMMNLFLPIEPNQLMSCGLNDAEATAVHRFLHQQDILAWDSARFSFTMREDYRMLMWEVRARYDDPLLGIVAAQQNLEESALIDSHHRDFVCTNIIEMMEDEREKLAATLMSTIDKDMIRRGLSHELTD